jgi:2,3-bisphosphoglycerate-independent phosphoglycerate mutase
MLNRCGGGFLKKILLIILDGLADLPVPELGNRTPLQVAKMPNLHSLAQRATLGSHHAMPEKDEYPTSDEAHFEILGYDYRTYLPGRGVLEALGLGLDLGKRELALRVNFGTVDENLVVLDPRAGNIKDVKSLVESVKEKRIDDFTFRLYPGLLHRAVLVISGPAISREVYHHSTIVSDTDPHKAKNHRGGDKVLRPAPIDKSPEAAMTADALWRYQIETHQQLDDNVENKVRRRQGLLPANFLLTRGAGFIDSIPSFHSKYGLNAACVAGGHLYKGIGRYLGMDVIDVAGATADEHTDINAKVRKALALLKSGYDFVFLHVKGTDLISEETGDCQKEIEFLERLDKSFAPFLKYDGVLCITGDHATPCILKDHSTDAVPIMIIGGERDGISKFDEVSVEKGSLGHLKGKDIMPILLREAKNV